MALKFKKGVNCIISGDVSKEFCKLHLALLLWSTFEVQKSILSCIGVNSYLFVLFSFAVLIGCTEHTAFASLFDTTSRDQRRRRCSLFLVTLHFLPFPLCLFR